MNLSFPKFLSIQTTSFCNASCVFCPYKDTKHLFPKQLMDMHLYIKIIDECSSRRNVERIILYMNNEPLTDPYLVGRINYAKEKLPWANVHILTNGSLLTEELSRDLIDSKLDWIGFSLHGIKKETVEKAMGLPYESTFTNVNKFIEKAKYSKSIEDYIMVTFLKHNYLSFEEKEEAIKYWQNKGIKRISYFDGPISRAGNVKSLPRIRQNAKIQGCNSIWCDEMMHIAEDGKVVLCCMDWKREVILGDLNRESVYQIWNGKRKKTWGMISGETDMPDNFLCKRCEEAITDKDCNITLTTPDILLVSLPPWGVDTPPLGLAALSSYLRTKGVEPEVFDLNIKLYNKIPREQEYLWSMNYSPWWRQEDKFFKIYEELKVYIDFLIEEIANSSAKTIGFSLPTNCSDFILTKILKKVKQANSSKIIILGGVSISIKEQREDLLKRVKDYVDYCVIGEGEDALYKLMLAILDKDDGKKSEIKGVLDKKSFFKDIKPVFIKDLETLPFVAFKKFNLKEYKISESISMEFSRGCIGNCPFCDFKIVSPSFRSKSALYVFNQIKFYKGHYDINHISVCDAAVNGNMEVLEKLCDLLIRDKLSVDISALAIPRQEMTEDLLKKMKRAGFYRLEYGVESGSDKILKAMRKIFTVETAERVIRNTYKTGIKTCLFFMVGYPGETEEDFNRTKVFFKKNANYITMIRAINPLYIMAGSELFHNPDEYNIILPAEDSDTKWYIKGKNTYDMRRQRVLELKLLGKELQIPFTEDTELLECTLDILKGENDKIDFLLVNLPPWAQDNPHIGIAYLASYLRNKGFKVSVLDFNKRFFLNNYDFRMLWHSENKNFWANGKTFSLILEIFKQDIEKAIEEILSYDCNILGFSVVDPKEKLTIDFIKKIKKKSPAKKIILGGASTSTYEQRKIFLENIPDFIDAFVVGEGEETVCRLLDRVLNKKGIAGVKGCYAKDNGRWFYKPRPAITPLDKVPFPTYEGFDLERYNKSLLIEWSRGCKGKCAFCKVWKLFPLYRAKSSNWVIDELKYHNKRYGIEEFTVVDNILNGDLKILGEICDKIIERNLKIRWSGVIIPHKNMDSEFFKRMKKAGCFKLGIGFESGSEKVLKLMRKPFTAEISANTIKFAKRAGIETAVPIIAGFPGESEKEFKKTCKFITTYAAYIDTVISINTLHLVAGTNVYENYRKYGIKTLPKQNWHCLWEAGHGNTYRLRRERVERLFNLAYRLQIPVRETNITEGKETELAKMDYIDKKILLQKINQLHSLKDFIYPKVKRALYKKLILLFIFVAAFLFQLYIIYLKVLSRVKGIPVVGDTK